MNEIADKPLDPREALALVGLDQRLDHFPSQLSGGEQQRVAVARAIVKSPDVLLCDEPTGALDYETGKVVLAAIARVNEQLGTTTVIITHNAAIAGMADRVLAWAADASLARSATRAGLRQTRCGGDPARSQAAAGYFCHARAGDHYCARGSGGYGCIYRFDIDIQIPACRA